MDGKDLYQIISYKFIKNRSSLSNLSSVDSPAPSFTSTDSQTTETSTARAALLNALFEENDEANQTIGRLMTELRYANGKITEPKAVMLLDVLTELDLDTTELVEAVNNNNMDSARQILNIMRDQIRYTRWPIVREVRDSTTQLNPDRLEPDNGVRLTAGPSSVAPRRGGNTYGLYVNTARDDTPTSSSASTPKASQLNKKKKKKKKSSPGQQNYQPPEGWEEDDTSPIA